MVPKKINEYAKLKKFEVPEYLYSREFLEARAKAIFSLCDPRKWVVRYAVKANPHPEIIKIFDKAGLHFDASSDYEVEELIAQGIDPDHISLSAQQPARDYAFLDKMGVKLVATSLHQLDNMIHAGVKRPIAVRINPTIGHGGNNKTNTGGISSSFGIWHEYIPRILRVASSNNIVIDRVHVHVGSGFDPDVWGKVMDGALNIVNLFPDVETLDIGGGYKVARVAGEHEADMNKICQIFEQKLNAYYKKSSRALRLELEPGTWLVANAGYLVSQIIDIIDTGKSGYTFLKLNTGMNDILRPSLYGAQHPMWVLGCGKSQKEYVVVGHNCESGDLLTPENDDPQRIRTRLLGFSNIGDTLIIGGAGAYCASMRARGYNSFLDANEVFI